MEPITDNPPLIVILGQTASGKSALAIRLAQKYNGEIIAADSRTIYRGLNIGTAKPTLEDMSIVPHHLIDVADPEDSFTVADFQRLALKAIQDITARGRLPIMVGGTGLYIDAILYDFSFRPPGNAERRKELDTLTVEQLQARLADLHIHLPQNERNPRHLIRSLESIGSAPKRRSFRSNTLVIGLAIDKAELVQKITKRVEAMVAQGLVEEVRTLALRYGWDAPALQTPAYKAFRPYLAGVVSLEDAKKAFVQNDMRYAKRQKTWFKRNMDIHWISKTEQSVDLITTFLNK